MKNLNKTTVIIAICTMVFGMLLGWMLFGNVNETGMYEQDGVSYEKYETIWTCSMHPQIRKNESGDCPICGMELIPLESSNDNLDPMAVSMSPTAMKLAQVQTLLVGQRNAEKTIRLNGKVQADERNLYTQSSHIPGRIEKLTVNFTGEFVAEGQEIAYIYSPELVNAQQELFEAKKIKGSQPALFDAAKEKLKNWKLTDKQINQIILSGKAIERFPILANVSGYVTKKMVHLGDYIKQGEAIYEIADLSKVWVLFDVYESEMSWIKKGAFISYEIKSIPGITFKAKISYIDPVIDPKTRVAKARVEQNNKNFLLKPEMFATGTLQSEITTDQSSLIVPKTAVMWTGKRSVVYVMQNTGQSVSFVMREVTLGPELGESYVIESGLQSGEEIAVHGTFSIDAAAQLAGKPSMMNPEGGVAMTGHNHGSVSKIDNAKPISHSQNININEEAKVALNPLFEEYLLLKAALVEDDFDKGVQSAGLLMSKLNNINREVFKGDAHNVLMQHSTPVGKALTSIQKAENIGEVRKHFKTVSDHFIMLAITCGPFDKELYIQHCPMANENKGADWISAEKRIQNPYFGTSMIGCGEVTREIKLN